MSFKVRGSLARKALIELAEKGLIKEVRIKSLFMLLETSANVQGYQQRSRVHWLR